VLTNPVTAKITPVSDNHSY